MNTGFSVRYGPWAVVTGASSGIGLAFAEALAERGLDLVLVARRAGRLDEIARRLADTHRIECLPIAADLADREAGLRIEAVTGPLDVGLLIAAAGCCTSGPLLDSDPDEAAAMVAVNCTAVMAQSRHFGRRFARRGRGGIVLMGSLVGARDAPRAAHEAAATAYVQSLAEGLRAELEPAGVDVIASAPDVVANGLSSRTRLRRTHAQDPASVARGTLDALGRGDAQQPAMLSKLLGWSPSGMPLRPLRVRMLGGLLERPKTPNPGAAGPGAPGEAR